MKIEKVYENDQRRKRGRQGGKERGTGEGKIEVKREDINEPKRKKNKIIDTKSNGRKKREEWKK